MDSSILWLAVPMGGLVLLNLTDKLPGFLKATRSTKPAEITGAICPCEHAINYHEALTGRCHAEIKRVTRTDEYGMETKWTWIACPCQVYAGPELLRGLIAPPPIISLPELPHPPRDDR